MYLGMVRQWQELFHDSNYSHVNLEASPDFVKLADAFGAHAIRCFQPSGVQAALEEAMAITDRPTVLDFRIAKEENVYPMIKSGGTIKDMVVKRPANMVPLGQLHGERDLYAWSRGGVHRGRRKSPLRGRRASGVGNPRGKPLGESVRQDGRRRAP